MGESVVGPSLFVLKTLEDPTGLALLELSVFISLQGKEPAPLDKVPSWMFPYVYDVIDIIINP